MSEYVITFTENGKRHYISGVAGPPFIAQGPGPHDFRQYTTPHEGLALTFATEAEAEKCADDFRAANPGRQLEVTTK